MGLTVEARRRALSLLFGGGLRVGLRTAHGEINDAGYRRMTVRFTEPTEDEHGSVFVANARQVRFPAFARDGDANVTGWFVVDESGTVLDAGSLERPRLPRAGEEAVIGAGKLVIILA